MINVKALTTGLIAGATLLTAAAPAEAQWRRNRGGDRTALAIGAGALGLAVGAAITSNGRRGWNGDRWNGGRRGWSGYGHPDAYGYGYGQQRGYAYGYGQPRGYAYGYGAPRGYDGWYGGAPRSRCYTDRVWDDWRGRWRRVRVCDRF